MLSVPNDNNNVYSASRMHPKSYLIWLPLTTIISNTADAIRVQERGLPEQVLLQPGAEDAAYVSGNAELDILNDPQVTEELFWSLASSDAAQSFDHRRPLSSTVRSRPIVLDNHNSGKYTGSASTLDEEDGSPASLQISMSTIGGFPIYHTPIAIGSPAQPFRAWLNMNLDGLYVRSAACSKSDCGRGFTYDQTKSTTRKSTGRRFEVHPKDWTVGGTVSTDTLHLVSVDIDNATVGEIDKYEGENLFYYVMEFVVDG